MPESEGVMQSCSMCIAAHGGTLFGSIASQVREFSMNDAGGYVDMADILAGS